jgi:hypothetical protein
MRSKAHTAPTAPLVLHRTRIEKYAIKNSVSMAANGGINFFIVIHHISLVKAAMMLHAFVN